MKVMHVSDITPEKGERTATFGGTRAGKSGVQDMTLRHVQLTRPSAMQVLIDSKPRYRAETERGRFRRGRKDAAYRYVSWEKGPVIPNSVVVDLWDERPFEDLFKRPGEVAILQSGEVDDWKRMLVLLRGFINAQIKGRERRIIVDECLDFTQGKRWVLTQRTMSFIEQRERERNAVLALILVHTEFSESPRSFFICYRESTCFTYARMPT